MLLQTLASKGKERGEGEEERYESESRKVEKKTVFLITSDFKKGGRGGRKEKKGGGRDDAALSRCKSVNGEIVQELERWKIKKNSFSPLAFSSSSFFFLL
eukprot:TRINITY_DN1837_c0_g2_i1.p1 TRINITY_DN1837_c0_g2~~TRINITY_DN1837_c0_g2_i1.p1  ORF type:complete len:109 (-),score=20.38 TRINITY_DN1837_c0_g2_i1:158-457(-)